MPVVVLFCLAMVLLAKVYTARRILKLNRRIAEEQAQLREARSALQGIVGRIDNSEAVAQAVARLQPARREIVTRCLKDLGAQRKLKDGLVYHIEELGAYQTQTVQSARIRVSGMVFPKVTVQIGTTFQTLEEALPGVVFYLNEKGTKIATGKMDRRG